MITHLEINREKLFKRLLFLLCFSFPLGPLFNNIAYGLLIALTIGCFSLHTIKRNLYNSLITLLFIFFFFMILFSLFYTENILYGIKIIIKMSPFLIIPTIILNFSDLINRKVINNCLKYFIVGSIISCLICLFYNVYQTYIWGAFNPLNVSNGNFFSYFNLTKPIHIHPIYFGSYLLLSISYLLIKVTESKDYILCNILLIIFFIIFTMLLNSFMLIILLGLIILSFVIYYVYRRKNLKWVFIVFLFSLYPIYEASYFLQEKVKGINIVEDFTTTDFSGNEFTAIKARNAKATLSIELIKNNILLGVGIGDTKEELLNTYAKAGFVHGVDNKFNSHNQYLTTFIGLGVIGFSILIFSIVIMYYEAILFKNIYLLFFVMIVSIFMLTESILERQAGIMFFTFFSVLLSYNYQNLKNEK